MMCTESLMKVFTAIFLRLAEAFLVVMCITWLSSSIFTFGCRDGHQYSEIGNGCLRWGQSACGSAKLFAEPEIQDLENGSEFYVEWSPGIKWRSFTLIKSCADHYQRPIWVAIMPFLVILMPQQWKRRRADYRRRAGMCTICAYNLTGLTEPRCPECGAAIKSYETREASVR